MSNLFGLVGDVVSAALQQSSTVRGAPGYGPLPLGIPALPPDPRLIAKAIDAIRAHDPGFDEAALLERARAVWYLVVRARTAGRPDLIRGAVSEELLGQLTARPGRDGERGGPGPTQGVTLRDAVISAAQVGPSLETVTVRFGVDGPDHHGSWEEDWVFQRSATATTAAEDAGAAGHCPYCGAPLQLDAAGTCGYCNATVLRAAGWVVVARNRLRPMTARDTEALALVAASADAGAASAATPAPPPAVAEGVDVGALGIDAYAFLASVRETVYAVAQARSQRHPELIADRVSGDLAEALQAEAATMTARHRHHVLAFLDVRDAIIIAAQHSDGPDRLTVRLQMSGEEYELADSGLEVVEGTQTMHSWSEDWLFERDPTGTWRATQSHHIDGAQP